METPFMKLGLLLATALASAFAAPPASDLFDVDVRQLVAIWEREHTSPADPYSMKHAELKRRLEAIEREYPGLTRREVAGKSVEGREIYLLRLGKGSGQILIWSQMHGDEPTGTNSMLDLFHFIGRHQQEPWVQDILQKFTLLCIPMLNPDGAERNQRRNAQGIDINRDARMLQTPEGRILKSVRDRFEPFLGFNLHNQNGLTTVGETGKVATIALLAVAADVPSAPQQNKQAGQLAKQVTAVLYEALSPFVYGHISRYDEAYNPRAFGDNLTFWGTPVVLIESGGQPHGEPENLAVSLNFVGILATLNSLATGRVKNANPAVFDSMRLNSDSPIYDLLLRNAWIFTGTGIPLFRGDIAVRYDLRARTTGESIIAEIGDLGVFSAHETIDCTRTLVAPGLIAWDPKQPLAAKASDRLYLSKGITTVLSTVPWNDMFGVRPTPLEFRTWQRSVNWSFLISGQPKSSEPFPSPLPEWLASGARAWVVEAPAQLPEPLKRVPSWFGVEMLDRQQAEKYASPANLKGDPAAVLPQWTSEAARQFHIPRRGIIAQGMVADLMLWTTPSDQAPADISECTPSRAIINGQIVDVAAGTILPKGRFLGR